MDIRPLSGRDSLVPDVGITHQVAHAAILAPDLQKVCGRMVKAENCLKEATGKGPKPQGMGHQADVGGGGSGVGQGIALHHQQGRRVKKQVILFWLLAVPIAKVLPGRGIVTQGIPIALRVGQHLEGQPLQPVPCQGLKGIQILLYDEVGNPLTVAPGGGIAAGLQQSFPYVLWKGRIFSGSQ